MAELVNTLLEYACVRAIRRDLSTLVTQIDIKELWMLDNPHHVE